MSHMLRVGERLDAHDAAVHGTGPYREPDQAAMGQRVSRCDDQKHPERRVDAEDHLQRVLLTRVPRPAGWPNDGERVDADDKYQTHGDQHHPQILDPICFAHGHPLFVVDAVAPYLTALLISMSRS